MDYRQLCEAVCIVAKDTGTFIRDQLHQVSTDNIHTKGRQNFVTSVDKEAEKRIIQRLEALLPFHA